MQFAFLNRALDRLPFPFLQRLTAHQFDAARPDVFSRRLRIYRRQEKRLMLSEEINLKYTDKCR